MGVNVIGHFLLAKILAPKTKRQVWLSSAAHCLNGTPPGDVHDPVNAKRINLDDIRKVEEATYDGWHRYQQSKLGDILLAKQFPLEYDHIQACSVHPGIVRTNLGRHLSIKTMIKYVFYGLFRGGAPIVTPDIGASTQTLCAVMPEEELVNGAYYADNKIAQEAESAKNTEDAKKLYYYCDEVTKTFQ
jgi:NAD(P)-dependent dehydrogenase (short-subunit alcohol dehydrogenase family)